MIDRRALIIGIGTLGVASVGGCLDILEEGVEAEADPGKIDEAVADDLGYERVGTEDYTIDESVEVAGETRDVVVTSWATTYSKDASDLELVGEDDLDELEGEGEDFLEQEGAGYAVIATPSESIAGQEINPVGRMSDEELIEEFNDELADGEVSDVYHVEEHPVETLDEETTANEFDAIVETGDGDTFDLKLYVTEVTHQDDIILGVGVHPEAVDEFDNVIELTENIVHPADIEN